MNIAAECLGDGYRGAYDGIPDIKMNILMRGRSIPFKEDEKHAGRGSVSLTESLTSDDKLKYGKMMETAVTTLQSAYQKK